MLRLAPGKAPVPLRRPEPVVKHCDLLVVGSGAAGLSAAVTARLQGLSVIVAEKAPELGGTTAVSGGWIWVPGNPVAARAGVQDSAEQATRYLQHEAGDRFDADRVAAYLEHGPRMVELFEQKTEVRFDASPTFPDYHSEAPGAACGRSIVATPYDGHALGARIGWLRRPLRETTLFGLNVGSGAELTHFFKATRSLASAAFVVRRVLAYAVDRVRHGRGMRLANGNALAGRLAQSAFALGVEPWLNSPVVRLETENGRVTGASVLRDGAEVKVRAALGVVLACGGFSHDLARRQTLYPHAPGPDGHHSPVPATNTGDGLRLGESAGGAVDRGLSNAAPWVPVSLVPHADGTTGVFPHVVDRAKPGVIAVTRRGERFVNEAHSYHDFVQAMIRANAGENRDERPVAARVPEGHGGIASLIPAPSPEGRDATTCPSPQAFGNAEVASLPSPPTPLPRGEGSAVGPLMRAGSWTGERREPADAGSLTGVDVVAFVVCDHRTLRRYGLGYVKPFPLPIGAHVASGYLLRGETLESLARRAGIDPAGLVRTVEAFNADARAGSDRAFGKGSTAYNRFQGDATAPHPCLAPIEHGPFYAVKIGPGDLGTFAGLRTDRDARVLDAAGHAIPGLYAAGNDAATLMGGNYSGAGINLGPAMVFGYLAALHAARSRSSPAS